jgi:SAM-dependent methyltransferase
MPTVWQLPGDSWRGKDVLELGAGIGRFTAELAQHASSVVAVDFVEASCRVNEQTNKHFPHIKVLARDPHTRPRSRCRRPGSSSLLNGSLETVGTVANALDPRSRGAWGGRLGA